MRACKVRLASRGKVRRGKLRDFTITAEEHTNTVEARDSEQKLPTGSTRIHVQKTPDKYKRREHVTAVEVAVAPGI